MILEGIVTTQNADGSTNISPMGPRVEPDWQRFILRPFQTSTTYRNLKRQGQGILHVIDDVEVFALAAIGALRPQPPLTPVPGMNVLRLVDTCRWYAFRVTLLDDATERTTIACETTVSGHVRDFYGFNRAKHAVIEGAILATRLAILPHDEIRAAYARLAVIVQKTAGEQERRAWSQLESFVQQRLVP